MIAISSLAVTNNLFAETDVAANIVVVVATVDVVVGVDPILDALVVLLVEVFVVVLLVEVVVARRLLFLRLGKRRLPPAATKDTETATRNGMDAHYCRRHDCLVGRQPKLEQACECLMINVVL